MDTLTCLRERKTWRGFLPKPVPKSQVQKILADAHWAPSASNQQPWHFHVITAEPLNSLNEAIRAAHQERQKGYDPSRGKTIPPRYVERTKQLFKGIRPLIAQLGDENKAFIESGSFRFYDAPVVIIVSMHRDMPPTRYMDIGMAAQNMMLSAHARGLGTCAIALTLMYEDVIRAELALPQELLPCLCIALGYPDPESIVNSFRSGREDLSGFITWHGGE